MILKKAEEKKIVEEVNPYDWPESYYMETDPEKRLKLLEAQNDPAEAEINKLRLELWNLRYEKMRNGKIKDRFIAGWMDLILMKEQVQGKFGKRGMKKQAQKALELMGIPQTEHFGKELLLAELKHMVLLYCCASMTDRQYSSIIFGFGKMKKEKIDHKIIGELDAVAVDIPGHLELQEESALLVEAIGLAKTHMGYDR